MAFFKKVIGDEEGAKELKDQTLKKRMELEAEDAQDRIALVENRRRAEQEAKAKFVTTDTASDPQ